MVIRRAKPEEADELSALAMRSKAYWGYDTSFMEACREALTVTKIKIAQHDVFLAEEGSAVAGFYCLMADGETGILDDMFIDPAFIGKGCGRLLWESMVKMAAALGLGEVTIDAEPSAEGFYRKMGAVRIGDVESTVFKERKLPLMKITIKESFPMR